MVSKANLKCKRIKTIIEPLSRLTWSIESQGTGHKKTGEDSLRCEVGQRYIVIFLGYVSGAGQTRLRFKYLYRAIVYYVILDHTSSVLVLKAFLRASYPLIFLSGKLYRFDVCSFFGEFPEHMIDRDCRVSVFPGTAVECHSFHYISPKYRHTIFEPRNQLSRIVLILFKKTSGIIGFDKNS